MTRRSWKTPLVGVAVISILGAVSWRSASTEAAPVASPTFQAEDAASAATVISDVIEAHGGSAAWDAARTAKFDHILYMTFLPAQADRWWVATNQVVEMRGDRRVYQDYPKHDARMAYDGNEVWSVNWGEGNTPGFMVYFDYYFVFLPWLAMEEGVILEEPQTRPLPGAGKEYVTVLMRFEPDRLPVGKTAEDFFRLFIDPETNELAAVEYAMGYLPMMAALGVTEGEVFGPLIHIFDSYADVDGLKVPRRYHTIGPDGEIAGDHLIVNVSLDEPFDDSRLERPPSGVVDETVPWELYR